MVQIRYNQHKNNMRAVQMKYRQQMKDIYFRKSVSLWDNGSPYWHSVQLQMHSIDISLDGLMDILNSYILVTKQIALGE